MLVLTFWSYRKNCLIRKTGLISKFMTSQSDYQTLTITILLNISQSKSNQAMKTGQVIEHNDRIYFSSRIIQKMRKGD